MGTHTCTCTHTVFLLRSPEIPGWLDSISKGMLLAASHFFKENVSCNKTQAKAATDKMISFGGKKSQERELQWLRPSGKCREGGPL
jgi:hypothetical protein